MLGPWTLLAFTLLVAAALTLLFARLELADLVLGSGGNDTLTETYLAQLHALQPGNARVALKLARLRVARGLVDEGLALAETHVRAADPALRREAMRVRLQALRAKPASDARLVAALHESLREPWPREELVVMASHAVSAGDAGLARRIYQRIVPHERDARWLEAAAGRFLGLGDYRYAAELYFTARRHARTPEAARSLYRAGVHALRSGNLPAEALAAAERELGDLAEDDAVLLELVHLARAANRSDVAASYMKRLLRMKPRERASLGERLLGALVGSAQAAPALPVLRTYDAGLYAFAYDVFLANRDLDSAYFVARAAVWHVPADTVWRERLARIAEQSGRARAALEAWRWLAERTGADAAWEAVLRLAPGLHDDHAVAAALRYRVERPQSRAADAQALADAYERLGQAAEGAAWFEARYRRSGELHALAHAADLAEESGHSGKAIALNLELAASSEPSFERLLRVATLQILGGNLAEAHALLSRFRSGKAAQSERYWSLLADLAWTLQDDASAIDALTHLTTRREADRTDFDRLVALLRPRDSAEAVRVARAGFERFAAPDLWLHAGEILWEKKDLAGLQRLYDELHPEQEALFDRLPYFYSLRAKLQQQRRELAAARRDLERALKIAPDDAEQRLALLWLLIENRDREALRPALSAASARAAEPAYWPALAAGWSVLDEPRRALPFLARLAQNAPDDFLWLAAYADALEQDGRMDAADRVRRHAWALARNTAPRADAPMDAERQVSYARLAMQQAPGDGALQVLRELVVKQPGKATDELVLSWLMSTEQHEQARRWLRVRYAGELSTPVWVEKALTAADGRAELASPAPADPWEESNRIAIGAARLRSGALDSRPRELAASGAPAPRLRIELLAREASQSSLDESVLRGVPAHDRALRLTGRHTVERRWIEGAIGAREAFADSVMARARYYQGWSQRLATLATAAHNEPTTDSTALAVAGMRDYLGIRGSYALSKTEHAGALLWAAGYRTQNGVRLGSAYGYEADVGHRVRLEYPDLALRAFVAGHRSRTRGAGDPATASLSPDVSIPGPDFFVPEGTRRYGVEVAVGESARYSWTRALRPYGGLGLIQNSDTGGGYAARAGLSAGVFGNDQLRLYWARAQGAGVSGERTLEYGIQYEYRFDRR